MSDPYKKSEEPMLPGISEPTSSPASPAGKQLSDLRAGTRVGPFGPDHALASHFLAPVNAEELRTSATSGLFGEDSSPSAVLQQSLESKLLQRMAAYGSLEYALTWKRWGMPSGPPICALRASGRRTSGKDFGGWPAATKGDSSSSRNSTAKRNKLPPTGIHAGHTLTDMASLSSGEAEVMGAGLAGWPCAVVPNGGRQPKGGKMSATGQTPDGKKRQVDLNWIAKMAGWPLCRANEGTGDKIPPGRTGAPALKSVAGWATARHNDAEKRGQIAADPRNGLPGQAMNSSTAKTKNGAVLNPALARWLQGYPAALDACAPTATRSTRM